MSTSSEEHYHDSVAQPPAPDPSERENERLALRRLSTALTGGNAGTWDEVFHAAESVGAEVERLKGEVDKVHTSNLMKALNKAEADLARVRAALASVVKVHLINGCVCVACEDARAALEGRDQP